MVDIVVPVSVRDLTVEDLPACAWSGTATHLAAVARELARARRGEVDYLAVCLRRLRPRAGCVGRWGPDGSVTRYETVCTLMRKTLP